jgi:23S rRNA pseudouridine955/2504/2580 synthase/23S rRNA pseudouridine1911/1915/1917 synthase
MNAGSRIINIIYEDSDYIIIDKPAGMPSIPARGFSADKSASEFLSDRFGKIFTVHRIDAETSGVLCFALNAAAHKTLNEQFDLRLVEKKYAVLVEGRMEKTTGTIDLPLREWKAGLWITDPEKGKPSITHWTVLENFRQAAYLIAEPQTGRQHQIRIHMKSISHPLLVDEKYGNRTQFFLSEIKPAYKHSGEEQPLMKRLTLHASFIKFQNKQGKTVQAEASLPADFEILLKQLRRWNKLQ